LFWVFFFPENVDDQVESKSAPRQVSEFKDFRMIDEIILELEKTYPSNSYENIIADQVNCTFNNFHHSLVRIIQDVLLSLSINSFLNKLGIAKKTLSLLDRFDEFFSSSNCKIQQLIQTQEKG
jgi:hypothetical protein